MKVNARKYLTLACLALFSTSVLGCGGSNNPTVVIPNATGEMTWDAMEAYSQEALNDSASRRDR